jgi:hypothetical protein
MPPHYCVALAFLALQQKVAIDTILGMVAFEQLCHKVEFWFQIWNNYITTYNLGCSYVFVLLQYMEGYCFICSLKMQFCVCIATKFTHCIIFRDRCNCIKIIATRYSLVAL